MDIFLILCKKNHTKVQVNKSANLYIKTIKIEFYTLVKESYSQYIRHISVSTGKAKAIREAIITFFIEYHTIIRDYNNWMQLTNINFGHNGRLI